MFISFVNVLHFVSARDLLAMKHSINNHNNNKKNRVIISLLSKFNFIIYMLCLSLVYIVTCMLML